MIDHRRSQSPQVHPQRPGATGAMPTALVADTGIGLTLYAAFALTYGDHSVATMTARDAMPAVSLRPAR